MAEVKKPGCWVLTSENNDYDQHGEYFRAAWHAKPSLEELIAFFRYDSGQPATVMSALEFLLHVQKGGGRQGTEDEWYNLRFVEFGKRFGGGD